MAPSLLVARVQRPATMTTATARRTTSGPPPVESTTTTSAAGTTAGTATGRPSLGRRSTPVAEVDQPAAIVARPGRGPTCTWPSAPAGCGASTSRRPGPTHRPLPARRQPGPRPRRRHHRRRRRAGLLGLAFSADGDRLYVALHRTRRAAVPRRVHDERRAAVDTGSRRTLLTVERLPPTTTAGRSPSAPTASCTGASATAAAAATRTTGQNPDDLLG